MHMYDVPAGTKTLLLENPVNNPRAHASDRDGNKVWQTRDFNTNKDLLFSDDMLIVDPIRVHNGNSGLSDNCTAHKLAERGYMVFTADPDKKQTYLLAVPFASVTTL